ncbi:MAG TPA: hypothetical protein VMX13_04500 [Sedimentisphaerales bacterium]|nr:hypothetical protein [Sedimentisphaerales bacterium]
MRPKLLALTALLALVVILCGCTDQSTNLAMRWAHEERMAKIKAGEMTRKEREDFAEIVAGKVVERLKEEKTAGN